MPRARAGTRSALTPAAAAAAPRRPLATARRLRTAAAANPEGGTNVWNRLEQHELNRRSRRMSGPAPGERPAPDRPAGTDLIPQIKHVVVLMMENHSYDNYLGTLAGRGDGFPLGPDGQPEVSNTGLHGETIPAHHLARTAQVPENPSQSWHATHLQWADGKLDGFVSATQQLVPGADPALPMGYWTEADLPFYHGLARTFPLADRWFSSCLGPTFPNRRFLISGTANGLIDDLPVNLADYPSGGTIFDHLTRHGISWVNYHPLAGGKTAFGRSRLGRAVRHRAKAVHRRLRTVGVLRPSALAGLDKDMQFTADIYPLGIARYMLHVRGTDDFLRDAKAGTLPAFSLVDPDFKAYSEENPQDIQKGESFASAIINAVIAGKGWMDTLLIWVYDEHGGYYDHVPPPSAVPPDNVPGRSVTDARSPMGWLLRVLAPGYVRHVRQLDAGPQSYDRYGFRVPAVVVSPYARPDHVTSETYDHTSILKLVQQKWNLPALTARDAAATSPLGALDFSGPPAFAEPPVLPGPALPWGSWNADT
jgi:phospholipase C